jgi:hypothetical protein
MRSHLLLAVVAFGLATAPAPATENLDWAAIGRIRDEGFRRSQVMETAAQLTDVYGPRLTGSPQYMKPGHARLSNYLNLDNGTGKIRGIYLQENAATRPVFDAWMAAVRDLGATRVSMRNTGGTDHQSFDSVGLPGFQFIQDPIEYSNGSFFGTHHTDMDVYDRLQRDDLMQAAVVIAIFAYQAASRDELLPRKPLPPVAPPAPAAPGAR